MQWYQNNPLGEKDINFFMMGGSVSAHSSQICSSNSDGPQGKNMTRHWKKTLWLKTGTPFQS